MKKNRNCAKSRDTSLGRTQNKTASISTRGNANFKIKGGLGTYTRSRREADKSNAIRYQRADQQTDIVWICHREVMQL
jgi:hypothetical protein